MTPPVALTSALLCAAALLPAAPARADTRYYGYAGADNRDPIHRLLDEHTGTTAVPAGYTATAGANSASVTTDAAGGGSITSFATAVSYRISPELYVLGSTGALGSIVYQPTLLGAVPATELVPVHVRASGQVEGVVGAIATATFAFTYHDDLRVVHTSNLIGMATSVLGAASYSRSFDLDQIVYVAPGQAMTVQLKVDVEASGTTPFGSTSWARAYVDPSFSIDDPALAALYHFEGIPGLATPVPEPASAALLLLGLAALALRRRRVQAGPAISFMPWRTAPIPAPPEKGWHGNLVESRVDGGHGVAGAAGSAPGRSALGRPGGGPADDHRAHPGLAGA